MSRSLRSFLFVAGALVALGPLALARSRAQGGCTPEWVPTFGVDLDDDVRTLAVFDDGTGRALYAGGFFGYAAGTLVNRIARWSGSSWSPLADGLGPSAALPNSYGTVDALCVFDDGTGPALHAAGWFEKAGDLTVNNVARWNGTSWSALGSGIGDYDTRVRSLIVFDDGSGPALIAGGYFTSAGGVPALCVAKWNGSTWSALRNGLQGTVNALAVYDDGAGPALYAGGVFDRTGGGTLVNNIARWDGDRWSPLGGGVDHPGSVDSLAVFDDGTGPALYAGGLFSVAGGVTAYGIARWDGASWSAVGGGTNGVTGAVQALAVFDDGTGPALYAMGGFEEIGGVPVAHVARWNGVSWSAVGGGTDSSSLDAAFAVFDDGGVPALYAGGDFTQAVDSGDRFLARWQGCDLEPPVIVCPDVVVAYSGPSGTRVSFQVDASDDVDPSTTVVCVPPSGSVFPPGTTQVTCTATDASGNQATCSFAVEVIVKTRIR